MGQIIYHAPEDVDMTSTAAPDANRGSLYRDSKGAVWVKTSWSGYYAPKWLPLSWFHFRAKKILQELDE